MSKGIQVVLFWLLCFPAFAQSKDSLSLNFKIRFDQFPLERNKTYVTSNKDSVAISTFKCYISAIEIQYADKTVFKETESYHLLDLENPNSLQIPLTKRNDKAIAKITFNIGIDSTTNTSGALAGDLDPTKGMYWAWQSGYVNMKLEGKSPSCQTRKNQFQFHLGGYLQPFYAMRRKVINVNGNDNGNDNGNNNGNDNVNDNGNNNGNGNVNIAIDVAVFLTEVNLAQTNSIMIPGKTAMDLADISAKMFYQE